MARTRLGTYGGPARTYGSFAGKEIVRERSFGRNRVRVTSGRNWLRVTSGRNRVRPVRRPR